MLLLLCPFLCCHPVAVADIPGSPVQMKSFGNRAAVNGQRLVLTAVAGQPVVWQHSPRSPLGKAMVRSYAQRNNPQLHSMFCRARGMRGSRPMLSSSNITSSPSTPGRRTFRICSSKCPQFWGICKPLWLQVRGVAETQVAGALHMVWVSLVGGGNAQTSAQAHSFAQTRNGAFRASPTAAPQSLRHGPAIDASLRVPLFCPGSGIQRQRPMGCTQK